MVKAKLTPQAIETAYFLRHNLKYSYKRLAIIYAVHPSTMWKALNRVTWRAAW